ncbi:MAG: sensor histidine kinase [Acidimicrobiales bacterium]
MITPEELARKLTSLEPDDLAHLQRLMGYWGMLADLCFSDLLMCAPLRPQPGGEPVAGSFVVVGQVRPSTTQTVLQEDLVGGVLGRTDQPLLTQAFATGELVDGEERSDGQVERVRAQYVPLRRGGRILAVLVRKSALSVGRRPGQLERTYRELFERFVLMLVEGSFPYPDDDPNPEEAPRVGDGVLVLDERGRLGFTSPNALNALHRMGVRSAVLGMRLSELGVDDRVVVEAFTSRRSVVEEIERPSAVVVLLRCLPLLEQERVSGGLVLVRDVSDLRRRDRLLVSKDATIREIHHRVKNNLQTISSLLRLQARRLSPGDGREALVEAERRIRSIAVVHDFLSRDVRDQVGFGEIVDALVRMAQESVLPGGRVRLGVVGDAGELPAGMATPLAVVISELLQNAVEHAFEGRLDGSVEVRLRREGRTLHVEVRDDGLGLPAGFDVGATDSLGLTIVRDLVEGQLCGKLELQSDGGLIARLSVPADQPAT